VAAEGPGTDVPQEVRERFVQVGNTFYFSDGVRAFTDKGHRLTTPSENTEVIRSLVTIAQVRGWSEITVRGTERFRKEAWFAARTAGLEVRGYAPTEFEQGHLVRAMSRGRAAATADPAADGAPPAPPPRQEISAASPRNQTALVTGRLIDHGRATYQHDPKARMSYFVKLETPRGDRVIWGVDLERSFKESLTRPRIGDEVGMRAVRQEPVKIRTQARGADGNVVGEKDLETHRNRWIVEKRDFFESRAAAARTVRDTTVDPRLAVKQHPELVGTYLQVHAAELAARRFRDPEDRQKFVAKVRSALADSVAVGEALPPVRLRARDVDAREARARRAPEREDVPVRG